jgi:hypothetical protein
MSDHFHLAMETPRGNLVAGVQWLESTFANRFNRFRDERGHLVQSRYKALLVEPGNTLGQLCTYIDLNLVRAGIGKEAKHRSTSPQSRVAAWQGAQSSNTTSTLIGTGRASVS